MQMPPPPPLLLTKRVTAFLRANLSPHIHSAMLTTPAGSLLAHASNLPATALRRQAAVAASLWALQGPANATPTSADQTSAASAPAGTTVRTRKSGKHSAPTVTVQLDSGAVFVIRRLRCGMLFICMGGAEVPPGGRLTPTPHNTRLSRSPAPTFATAPQPTNSQDPSADTTHLAPDQHRPTASDQHPSTPPSHQFHPSQTQIPTISTPPTSAAAAPTTPSASTNLHQSQINNQNSPSQASILSTHTSHTTGAVSTTSTTTFPGSLNSTGNPSVSLMRRQVEELARWLDERLGGLCVPEEGIGIGIGIVTGNGGLGQGVGNAEGNGNGNGNEQGNGLEVR